MRSDEGLTLEPSARKPLSLKTKFSCVTPHRCSTAVSQFRIVTPSFVTRGQCAKRSGYRSRTASRRSGFVSQLVRSKVHSALHPYVIGKVSTSITGDKLCTKRDWISAQPPSPSVICGRSRSPLVGGASLCTVSLSQPLSVSLYF